MEKGVEMPYNTPRSYGSHFFDAGQGVVARREPRPRRSKVLEANWLRRIFQVSKVKSAKLEVEYESAQVMTSCCTALPLTILDFLRMTWSTVEVNRDHFK